MTAQPYREPATVTAVPDRIETLGLRRYPIVVQAFVLAWFPLVSLVTAAFVPSTSVTCTRVPSDAPPSCSLERSTLFHTERLLSLDDKRDSIRAEARGGRARVLFTGAKSGLVSEELEVGTREAEAMVRSYESFYDSRTRGNLELGVHPLRWLYLLLAGVEAGIGIFFVVVQRKIFLDLNHDKGVVHVAQGGRFGPIAERDIGLADVQSFDLQELDSNGQRKRVSVTMRTGANEVLFDATAAEARRGAKFLEAALQRWREVHGSPAPHEREEQEPDVELPDEAEAEAQEQAARS